MSGEGTYREAATAGPSTVLGVALEPGERVLFVVKKPEDTTPLRDYILLGVGTVVVTFLWYAHDKGFREAAVGVGGALVFLPIVLVLVRIFMPRDPLAQVITDRRVIEIDSKGKPDSLPLTELVDVNVLERPKGSSSGRYGNDALGAVSAAIDLASQISNTLDNREVEKATKASADYWRRVTVMEIVGRSKRMKLRPYDSLSIGVVLMRFLHEPGAVEREAAVAYDP